MSPCRTCGHRILVHYPNNEPCITPGCTCTKYEPTKHEPTQGGDAHDHALVSGHERDSDAGTHVTGPATDTPAVAGPSSDLQQAIHAATEKAELLREFALHAADWLRPKMPDGFEMNYSLITLRVSLLKGATALEQLQAAQAENQQLREVLRRSTTIHAADRDGRCTFCMGFPDHAHCWYCGIREPSHLNDCVVAAALEQQAAPGQVDQ